MNDRAARRRRARLVASANRAAVKWRVADRRAARGLFAQIGREALLRANKDWPTTTLSGRST